MITKELTSEILERHAVRARNPQTAAVLRSGCIERVTDFDGTVYLRRDLFVHEGGPLITKSAPPPTTTSPGPVAPPPADDDLVTFFKTLGPDPEIERRAARVAKQSAREAERREKDARLIPVFEELEKLGGAA